MSATETPKRVSRRAFLGAAAGSAAWLAAGGLGGLLTGDALAARPTVGTRNPLYKPPTVSPTGLQLMAAPSTVSWSIFSWNRK